MNALKIALTGGIAEGKSTLLKFAEEVRISVLSADEVVHQLMCDIKLQQKVAFHLNLSAPISKAGLKSIILDSPLLRRRLNSILHPLVLNKLLCSKATLVEIPLLIETCIFSKFDQVWVVTCGRDVQWYRLCQRFANRSLAEKILETQLDTKVKIPFADRLFDSQKSLECLKCDFFTALREEGILH